MIARSDINRHFSIVETFLETGPVFLRFLFHLRLVVPPASVHDVARVQGEIRALFLQAIKKPVERILPPRLGVADVPVEDIGDAGESNVLRPALRRGRQVLQPELQPEELVPHHDALGHAALGRGGRDLGRAHRRLAARAAYLRESQRERPPRLGDGGHRRRRDRPAQRRLAAVQPHVDAVGRLRRFAVVRRRDVGSKGGLCRH